MKKKIYTLALALLGLFCSVDVMAQVEGLTPVTDLQDGQYYIYCTTTQRWLNDDENSVFTEKPTAIWSLSFEGNDSNDKNTPYYTLTSNSNKTFAIYNSTENEKKASAFGSGISPVASSHEIKTGNDILLKFTISTNGTSTIYRINKTYNYTNKWGQKKTDDNSSRNVNVSSEGILSAGTESQSIWIFYAKSEVDEYLKPKATAEMASAYNSAMTKTSANISKLGFVKNTYAPYNHAEAIKAYQKFPHTLNAGNALPCEEEDFKSLVENLNNWTVNNSDVEAIFNSDFATDDIGWENNGSETNNIKKSGDITGYQTNGIITYGNIPGYTLPLEANTQYELTFSYAAGGSLGSIYSSNGVAVSVKDGNNATINLDKENNCAKVGGIFPNNLADATVLFTTGDAGNYVLNLTSQNPGIGSSGTVITNIHLNKVYPGTTVTAASHWGTYITEAAREEIPEGLEAYTVEGFEGDVLTLAKATSIEANVPYLLKNTSKENDAEIPYVLNASGVKDAQNNGCLKGVYEKTTVPAGAFILYQPEGSAMGFYKVGDNYAEENKPYVNANRCYLQIPESKAKAFRLEGVATAIEAAESLINGKMTEVYSVNGAKLSDIQKGMNIVRFANGKTAKILVK